MGWQEDLARTNDPYLMTPAAVRKSAAASNRARRNRNIIRKDPGEDVRRGFVGDLAQMGGDLSGSVTGLPIVQDARQMLGDLSGPIKELGIVKDARQMYGDLIRDPIKEGLAGLKLPSWMMMDSVTQNWAQNAENEEILGDAYTDELRKTMVPNWDVQKGDPGYEGSRREYHDKYKNLASLTDDADKKQYYLDQARSAYRNANVTRRVNYALGDLGFDTSAEAGKAAFGETPTEFKGRIDYGALPGKLQRGLEGTDVGQSFIRKHAIPKIGDTPAITKAIENFNVGLYPNKYRDTPKEPIGLYPNKYRDTAGVATPPLSQSELMDVTQSDIPDPGYWPYPAGMSTRPNNMSHWLQGIYPKYAPNPIFDELEDMDEQELLDWGALNPNEAEVFGFNPYYSNSWID